MNCRSWLWMPLWLGIVGCAHQQARLQSDDEAERDKAATIKTIGDVTEFANVDPIPVSGVGLVVGLEGTGGSAPPGGFRTLLEDELKHHSVPNVKELLASPNTSMVLVSAMILPGAHKLDILDVEVTLPPQSKTTSLRGGYLKETILSNYDTTKNLNPSYAGGNHMLKGHAMAKAEGYILTGSGDGDESSRLKRGKIWAGGRCYVDRAFYLVMKNDQRRAVVAQRVAERINETFHGPYRGSLTDMAEAKSDRLVTLKVPHQYRLNLPRYLRVIRMIPLVENPSQGSPYRQRLEEQLEDPAHAVTAALRLEALGSDSTEILKKGLESEHPLVRFCSAEALAYLGSPSCGEELGKAVEQQPMLRAFALTAMASLDEAICHVKLTELLNSADQEVRYGAFRALRALDEKEPAVEGELVNNSFWLHRVAPNSPSLVHLSCSRRAEVVLFGEGMALTPPFSFLAGEFTITANKEDDRCTISRFSESQGTHRRQCSLKLEETIRTMADLGAAYPDIMELLRQVGACNSLTCQVAVDALPQAVSVVDIAEHGAKDPDFLKKDEEILRARDDFGPTPTLFEKSVTGRTRSSEVEQASDEDEPRQKLQADKKRKDTSPKGRG